MAVDTPPGPLQPSRWQRGDEPEFTRPATFTDGVYAIALTLLVLGVHLDRLRHPDSPAAMWHALGAQAPDLIAFGIAFVLLGRYWIAHHDFYSSLGAVDRGLIGLNLVYLLFVAFLPFPASLIGDYEGNPLSVLVFAVVLAGISGMETAMFVHAHHGGMLRSPLSPTVFRWGVLASLAPVAVLLVTMPFAYLSTTGVLVSWAVLMPVVNQVVCRAAPEEADGSNLPMVATRNGHAGNRRQVRGAHRDEPEGSTWSDPPR